ncbi:unnamed protein product [Hydatigera taeniaeformis]|uniref:Secreted protein n=1 Tax=Hydatigena taeniaeformis TaxID=6205 RepID=A0A0R3X0B2_HYDTA|nr:unnamed protein product [Hydatigera taeniaeformis]
MLLCKSDNLSFAAPLRLRSVCPSKQVVITRLFTRALIFLGHYCRSVVIIRNENLLIPRRSWCSRFMRAVTSSSSAAQPLKTSHGKFLAEIDAAKR